MIFFIIAKNIPVQHKMVLWFKVTFKFGHRNGRAGKVCPHALSGYGLINVNILI